MKCSFLVWCGMLAGGAVSGSLAGDVAVDGWRKNYFCLSTLLSVVLIFV